MSISEELAIFLRLVGQREAIAGLEATTVATEELGGATATLGREMETTRRRSFLMNQALFTTRRLLYMSSLAFIGIGIAAVDMGFKLDSTMQQATIAIQSFIKGGPSAAHKELISLYKFAAYTPFQFKDILQAGRTLLGFQVPLDLTNRTLRNIVDVLSARGGTALSPGGLNRVTVALGHMMNTGRITGQILLQLARDGVPLYKALQQQLGLTADQVHHIGQLGIPATTVLNAINRYIEGSTFHGAAYRQATGTLRGLFTTFKDFFALVAGRAELPLFGGLFVALRNVNDEMAKSIGFTKQGTATIHNFGDALDRGLGTPLHLITNYWTYLSSTLKIFWAAAKPLLGSFILALAAILAIMAPIAHVTAVILVPLLNQLHYLEPLLALFIARWLAIKVATELAWIAAAMYRGMMFLVFGTTEAGAALSVLRWWRTIAILIFTASGRLKLFLLWEGIWEIANSKMVAALSTLVLFWGRFAFWLRQTAIWTRAVAIGEGILTAAQWLLNIAMDANPIGLLILGLAALAVGIVLLVTHLDWARRHWYLLLGVPVVGEILGIIRVVKLLIDHFKQLVGWVQRAIHWLGRMNPFSHANVHGALHYATHPWQLIPGLQAGGTAAVGGWSLVGEQGPELAYLPTGASVVPLSQAGQVSARRFGGDLVIRVPVNLDGRQIAEVVARHENDWLARR